MVDIPLMDGLPEIITTLYILSSPVHIPLTMAAHAADSYLNMSRAARCWRNGDTEGYDYWMNFVDTSGFVYNRFIKKHGHEMPIQV